MHRIHSELDGKEQLTAHKQPLAQTNAQSAQGDEPKQSPAKKAQTTKNPDSVGGSNVSTKENTAADSKYNQGDKSQVSGNVIDLDQLVAQESYSNTTFDLTPKQTREDSKQIACEQAAKSLALSHHQTQLQPKLSLSLVINKFEDERPGADIFNKLCLEDEDISAEERLFNNFLN